MDRYTNRKQKKTRGKINRDAQKQTKDNTESKIKKYIMKNKRENNTNYNYRFAIFSFTFQMWVNEMQQKSTVQY